LDCSSLTSV
jgi:hypothetical protein